VTSEQDVDVVVLALPPAHAAMADQLRQRCETLGVPAYAAATFVEMHFAGAPALIAHESPPALGEGSADPDSRSRN
jgi:hypothetical protein